MAEKFRQALASGRVMVLDGAMGTQIAARGGTPGVAATLDTPEIILAIHREYVAAGAEVLTTNTFGANRPSLARAGREGLLARYVVESCRLAREALGGRGFLAGNIGPSGEFLEPYGSMTETEMSAVFEESARALAENGVDLFLVETMSDAAEIALAVRACRAVAPQLAVVATMSFDPAPGNFRTNTGLAAADAAAKMAASGADAVGANCGSVTPEQMVEIIGRFRGASKLPLVAQANAGLPELVGDRAQYSLAPEIFGAQMVEAARAGAVLVGGCCGTTPDHIRAVRDALVAAGLKDARA